VLTHSDFCLSRNQHQEHPSLKDLAEPVAEDHAAAADEVGQGASAVAVEEAEAVAFQEAEIAAEVVHGALAAAVVAVVASRGVDEEVEASVVDVVATRHPYRLKRSRHDYAGLKKQTSPCGLGTQELLLIPCTHLRR
jgi:hypothetical protein